MWKDKATATAAKAEIAQWEGVYTLSLAPGDDHGSGYLSLTVGKDGNVKATGKLADGTGVTATSPLLYDPDKGWFAFLYAAPSSYKGGAFAIAAGFDARRRDGDGAPEKRIVDSMDVVQWTSRNAEATGEYGAGFSRTVMFTGAYYDKLDRLNAHYESLRLVLHGAPSLGYTYKETRLDESGRKVTASSELTAEAVDTFDQSGLTAMVDEKGSLVLVKATKPVQDKETKMWRYEGVNDGALTLSFAQATGVFKGTYTFWYDYESARDMTTGKSTMVHASKKVKFEGITVQGEETLSGYYLWEATGRHLDPKTSREKTFKYKISRPVLFELQ